MREFAPDIVGISVFTYLFDECCDLIKRVSSSVDIPIILGGPHFAVFPDAFSEDDRISYILRGEADGCIVDVVNRASRQPKPVFIDCPLPLANEIPEVDLSIAVGSEYLSDYQIQLSRGCPYHCAFCNIEIISGRHVRERDVEACLAQIKAAKKKYPHIRNIIITDDCPNANKTRFKEFLQKLGMCGFDCQLWVDNIRANLVDEEMLDLYVAVHGLNICLGVESGNPEVFNSVNKGETLDEIVSAANAIKEKGLKLGLCFVIGLPGDTLEKHRSSMALAKRLKPDYVFWNMCIPWPRTRIYQWFLSHGEIFDIRNFSTLIDPHGVFRMPVADSFDFTRAERVRAWLMANMTTHNYFVYPQDFGRLFWLAVKYRIWSSFLIYFWKTFLPAFWEYLTFIPGGLRHRLRRLIWLFD